MSEAEMYPSTDYPTYSMDFDTLADLREHFEDGIEGLNFPVSWNIYDERDEDWDGEGDKFFALCVFMPRKTATTEFRTSSFDRAELDAWLNGYIRERVYRWYGWGPA